MLDEPLKTRRHFSVGTVEKSDWVSASRQRRGGRRLSATNGRRGEEIALSLQEGSCSWSPPGQLTCPSSLTGEEDPSREQLRSLNPPPPPPTEFLGERGGSANQLHLLQIWDGSVGTFTRARVWVGRCLWEPAGPSGGGWGWRSGRVHVSAELSAAAVRSPLTSALSLGAFTWLRERCPPVCVPENRKLEATPRFDANDAGQRSRVPVIR